MHDYVYPSIFLAYFMFFIFLVGGIFFLVSPSAMATGARTVKILSTACSPTTSKK